MVKALADRLAEVSSFWYIIAAVKLWLDKTLIRAFSAR